jgi:hypothetical protein
MKKGQSVGYRPALQWLADQTVDPRTLLFCLEFLSFLWGKTGEQVSSDFNRISECKALSTK